MTSLVRLGYTSTLRPHAIAIVRNIPWVSDQTEIQTANLSADKAAITFPALFNDKARVVIDVSLRWLRPFLQTRPAAPREFYRIQRIGNNKFQLWQHFASLQQVPRLVHTGSYPTS